MIWDDVEEPWKECFRLAWISFVNEELPIGAVVATRQGTIVSTGRNCQKTKHDETMPLSGNSISHAEMNAIIGMYRHGEYDLKECILYTTTEPCPMCFGTYLMSDLHAMKYAAREPFAGAGNLRTANDYLRGKSARYTLEGPETQLEEYQMLFDTIFTMTHSGPAHPSIAAHAALYPKLLEHAGILWNDKRFRRMLARGAGVEDIFPYVTEKSRL